MKANAILKGFLEDPRAVKNEAASVLIAPVQHFMNAAFAADGSTTTYCESACHAPVSSDHVSDESLKAYREAKAWTCAK